MVNAMKLAENAAAVSDLSPEKFGEFSRVLNEIAAVFKNVGEKQAAKLLMDYARGFNRAAGKRGKAAD